MDWKPGSLGGSPNKHRSVLEVFSLAPYLRDRYGDHDRFLIKNFILQSFTRKWGHGVRLLFGEERLNQGDGSRGSRDDPIIDTANYVIQMQRLVDTVST